MHFDRKLIFCKSFSPSYETWGSVSNLLVERMPGFVLSLESQKVNLAQLQEQIPHIEQPTSLGLNSLDRGVS